MKKFLKLIFSIFAMGVIGTILYMLGVSSRAAKKIKRRRK